jgi:hypothetical protein
VTDRDLLSLASQTVCELCHSNTASFRYELFSTCGSLTGNCCLTCFPNLLKAMKGGASNAVGQAEGQVEVLSSVSLKSGTAD